MVRVIRSVLCAGALLIGGQLAGAAEWGDLTGQILFEGTPPIPEKATITSDKEVCCEHDVVDESLLVDPQSKGVQNVIVMMTRSRTDKREVPIHGDYEALKEKPVRIDNNACRFDPHVSLIWTGARS